MSSPISLHQKWSNGVQYRQKKIYMTYTHFATAISSPSHYTRCKKAQLKSKMSSRKNLVPELCSEIKLEYLLLNHEAAWCARGNISATAEFIVHSNYFRGRLLKLTQPEEQLGTITWLGVCSHFTVLLFFWISLIFSFLYFITFLNFTLCFVFNLNGMKDCLKNQSYRRHSMLTWFIAFKLTHCHKGRDYILKVACYLSSFWQS